MKTYNPKEFLEVKAYQLNNNHDSIVGILLLLGHEIATDIINNFQLELSFNKSIKLNDFILPETCYVCKPVDPNEDIFVLPKFYFDIIYKYGFEEQGTFLNPINSIYKPVNFDIINAEKVLPISYLVEEILELIDINFNSLDSKGKEFVVNQKLMEMNNSRALIYELLEGNDLLKYCFFIEEYFCYYPNKQALKFFALEKNKFDAVYNNADIYITKGLGIFK